MLPKNIITILTRNIIIPERVILLHCNMDNHFFQTYLNTYFECDFRVMNENIELYSYLNVSVFCLLDFISFLAI